MKIALINPDNGKAIKKENLGLLSLATHLKTHGLDVRLIDEVAGDKTPQVLHAFSPDVVGISFMTMFAKRAAEITRHVRENHPRAKIIFGGAHPTACPEESAALADTIITGEAESSLLEHLQKDHWTEKIIQGRYEQDLDALPIPDRGLINAEYYLAQRMGIAGIPLRSLSLSTSRGCPYRCIFCQNSKRTVPVRVHSISRVLQEIHLLTGTYQAESLAFVDENFAFNRNRLAELCRGIIREKIRIKWECQTSANLVDEEILSLAKQSGAVQIAFGFESGSQRILNTLGKKSTVEQNRRAIALVKKAGLKVRGCFMVGNPTETLADIRLTQAFIQGNDIDYTGVFMATPYPGTELWDYCVNNNLIDSATVDYDTFTTGTDVTPYACTAVDRQSLKRVYAETVYQSMRKNYGGPRLLLKCIRYPKEALALLRDRLRPGKAKQ
ncbi:MAG: radical SAM protein [Fibrobacterota bacterium]